MLVQKPKAKQFQSSHRYQQKLRIKEIPSQTHTRIKAQLQNTHQFTLIRISTLKKPEQQKRLAINNKTNEIEIKPNKPR